MMTQPQAPGGAASEPGMGEPIHLEGGGGGDVYATGRCMPLPGAGLGVGVVVGEWGGGGAVLAM
jgi:hypothetical protein